jgi:hypothetical protein
VAPGPGAGAEAEAVEETEVCAPSYRDSIILETVTVPISSIPELISVNRRRWRRLGWWWRREEMAARVGAINQVLPELGGRSVGYKAPETRIERKS